MDTPAIRTENLTRTYRLPRRRWGKAPAPDAPREFTALAGVTLDVRPGELFGLLGPNGAGKTTLIKILTTLLAPTSGTAEVGGLDVVSQARRIRPFINMVSGGESSGYGILNVRENLWLFARMYGVPTALAHDRIDSMLGVVGLTEKAGSRVSHLSTGQRQKMNFCRGFITDPKVLFLDEPTLGLDVTSARAIRGFVREWMKQDPSRTLLLTTHYMAEADDLCDRLAIIDQGKVLACDTPGNLKKRVQEYPIFELSLAPGSGGWAKLGDLPGVHQSTAVEKPESIEVKVALFEEPAIGAVVQTLATNGARILALKKVEPTLEDVFIELVGHGLADAEETTAKGAPADA
ncbi:ABC transporter ATP-binding protein [bacterium]|nr:ABC transporter ATP-binding protein [bacterium]